ncbi:hypothetical protein [Xanthomonas medicagonis]|uniref:hypothetical protein n=1 Tax=Xanthomonas medicagonis TaxID=3160841 RepID=UPI003512EAFA
MTPSTALRSSLPRTLALAATLLLLAACNAGEPPATTAPAAAPATPAAQPAKPAPAGTTPAAATADAMQALIQASGTQCPDATGSRGCEAGNLEAGDFYDVDLSPQCDAYSFAGVVRDEGVDALDRVPTTGSASQARAHFAPNQFVCVQAIARAGQNPMYYYVVAVPTASVEQCKGKDICSTYGDRPIQRRVPGQGGACRLAAPGIYVGDCAQGWVSAEALEVFSNGI